MYYLEATSRRFLITMRSISGIHIGTISYDLSALSHIRVYYNVEYIDDLRAPVYTCDTAHVPQVI